MSTDEWSETDGNPMFGRAADERTKPMTDVDDYWEPGDDREPDPPEPDWDQVAEDKHSWAAHGGRTCDCPEPPRRFLDLPHDFPRIVVLCGSTRFSEAFRAANLKLTLSGVIVLSIGCDTKSDGDLAVSAELGDDPAAIKARLDELHKRKIDLADECLVVSRGGYLGVSTRSEIAYALACGKPVRFMEPEAKENWRAGG